jgi:hypothetical protein
MGLKLSPFQYSHLTGCGFAKHISYLLLLKKPDRQQECKQGSVRGQSEDCAPARTKLRGSQISLYQSFGLRAAQRLTKK